MNDSVGAPETAGADAATRAMEENQKRLQHIMEMHTQSMREATDTVQRMQERARRRPDKFDPEMARLFHCILVAIETGGALQQNNVVACVQMSNNVARTVDRIMSLLNASVIPKQDEAAAEAAADAIVEEQGAG
jgi:hypothetical protein